MVYKGQIKKNSKDDKMGVEINLFGKEIYEVAGYVTCPGIDYSELKSGTNVYVCLLNNDLSTPVVVGVDITSPMVTSITNGNSTPIVSSHLLSSTNVNFDSVVINTSLELPEDSTIGEPQDNGDNKLVTRKELEDAVTNVLNKILDEVKK